MSGSVIDHDGTPIAGAEVLARGKDTGGALATETDDGGRFVLRGLNATPELYIVARKPGWAEEPAGPFALNAKGIENLIVQIDPESALEGHVIDQLGRPVPDATVTAYPAKDYPFREPEATTKPNPRRIHHPGALGGALRHPACAAKRYATGRLPRNG